MALKVELIDCQKDEAGNISDYCVRFLNGKHAGLIMKTRKDLFEEFVRKNKVEIAGCPVKGSRKKTNKKTKLAKPVSPDDF